MDYGNGLGSTAQVKQQYDSSVTTRETEIPRELSRIDSLARETSDLLGLLETRLASVLRSEPEGKSGSTSVPPPSTMLGSALTDLSARAVMLNTQLQSILSRL